MPEKRRRGFDCALAEDLQLKRRGEMRQAFRRYMIKDTGKKTTWFIGMLLVIVTLLAFYPAFNADFITYDDPFYVYDNPPVREGLSWATVKWAFTAMHASNWHPLAWLSHALDCQLFGLDARGHHATNVVLHTVNSFLVFLLLQQLTGARWRSAFVAALFAVHPMHVESVAWVSERKDVLCAFFGLLTLMAYARYARAKPEMGRARHSVRADSEPLQARRPRSDAPYRHLLSSRWYWFALVCFALGLMSKPMLVTWPFVMLLLDYWPLGRVPEPTPHPTRSPLSQDTPHPASGHLLPKAEKGSEAERAFKPEDGGWKMALARWRPLIAEKLPFFALAAVSCRLTVMAQSETNALAMTTDLTLADRLANAVIAYGWYVWKLFWPVDLAIIYPLFSTRDPFHVIAGAAVLTLGTALVLWQMRRHPWLFTGWFWYVGTLVPVIGLVQVGMQAYADRYTYLPYLGLFLLLTWAAGQWLAFAARPRPIGAVAGTIIVLLCVAMTNQQVRHWRDARAVFERAIAVTPDNYLAHRCLGQVLAEAQHYDQAIDHYREALRIAPQYVEAWKDLGYAHAANRQPEQALKAFQEAQRIRPHDLPARNRVALMLHETGDYTNARAAYEAILTMAPDYAEAHYHLANTLAALGNHVEAAAHLRSFLANNPNNAPGRVRLAMILAQLGQIEVALAETHETLGRDPGHAPAYYCLGVIQEQQGHTAEAKAAYEQALELQPDYPEVLNNLAWLLTTCTNVSLRDGKRAVTLAQRACELTRYESPLLIGTLAAALAESGRFDEAVSTAERAIKAAEAAGDPQAAATNRELLERYRLGRAARP